MNYEEICANVKAQKRQFLTQAEVATLCHLSKKTIYKLEQSGKLPYELCFNHLIHTHKIKTDDILEMLKERHCKQGQGSLYLRTMKCYYTDRLHREKDVLTIHDVIRLTGFSKSGVLNWLSLKKLKAFRMGRFYMIPKRCLLDFWLSPTYRTIKNKSAVQKADNANIEGLYHDALSGGSADE